AVGIAVPEALDADGSPITGQARLGFQPIVDAHRRRLADLVLPTMGQFRALPAADLEEAAAVLTERDWFNGPARTLARGRWRFADAEHVELEGGFKARTHYELTYTTSRCPVTGAGLVAVQDVVAHLRPAHTHTLAMGVSQSGRWLRQFLFDTGNADEDGQPVFDGVHVHIAGGRRGEFNHRYAQPSTMNPLGFTHLPPFSPDDGLLDRAEGAGTVPKIVFTNTATEYWRGDASLSHPTLGRPTPDGPSWRTYLYAGAHHSGQLPGHVESLPVQLPGNLVDITWPTRAHFSALSRWVVDGTEPPPSAVPQVEDGTAVSREQALAVLPSLDGAAVAGLTLPSPAALLGMPPLDLGPEADRGVGCFPPVVTAPSRPCVVSALDDDGNEVAGVRLPHVAVPLDISFGWNPEHPRPGIPVEVWNLVGGRLPFTAAEVVRRYGDRDAFLTRVREAAARLVVQRHLLAEDVEPVVADAARRWDALVG
ncbi:MAG TPA: alpha/beta hydrolase domain-containing protein, partial [Acidimicrobiales bacterium]